MSSAPISAQTPAPAAPAAALRRTQSKWAIRQPVPRGTAAVLAFVMPALVLGAWCVISYGGLAPADFLPSPTETIRGTLQLFIQYDLLSAIRRPLQGAGSTPFWP